MLLLVVGLLIFFSVHLLPTAPEIRDGLKQRLGPSLYRVSFNIVSVVGLIIIILGYHKIQVNPGKNVFIWSAPEWLHYLAWVLMFPAIIFLVAAYVPSRLRVVLKHPMLAGIKLWALSHILVNGDLASFLLFGTFLTYSVYDRISISRREKMTPTVSPTISTFGDFFVFLIGVIMYFLILLKGHEWFIGVPLVHT